MQPRCCHIPRRSSHIFPTDRTPFHFSEPKDPIPPKNQTHRILFIQLMQITLFVALLLRPYSPVSMSTLRDNDKFSHYSLPSALRPRQYSHETSCQRKMRGDSPFSCHVGGVVEISIPVTTTTKTRRDNNKHTTHMTSYRKIRIY